MLYVVLVLVLVAVGLVVAGLITANTLWAWLSVSVSVLAAVLLLVDWLRRRKRASDPAAATPAAEPADSLDGEVAGELPADKVAEVSDAEKTEIREGAAEGAEHQTALLPATGELGEKKIDEPKAAEDTEADATGAAVPVVAAADSATDDPADDTAKTAETPGSPEPESGVAVLPPAAPDNDPAEEDTDAADLLVVSELSVEVLVVDEYPRYHLADCRWLIDRDTIPIAVAEARELGFTPCARCGPDARLAAEHGSKAKGRGKLKKAGK